MTALEPLAEIPIDPWLAALPKADLHLHQEIVPRLDRVLARQQGRSPYDWRSWAHQLMRDTSPGLPRLTRLGEVQTVSATLDAEPDYCIARLEDLLDEAGRDGAVLVEVRCGNETLLQPDFLSHFREAARRARERHPRLHAIPVVILLLWLEPERLERLLVACLRAAREGLAGIDLLYRPYTDEADWGNAYRLAARAAEAGLGITAHAGEFSPANIAAALRVPGLTRLGHAVHATTDSRLLDEIAARGVTIECCLSCNVVLGAVPSYANHPIRALVERGIPVALGTDNPVQIATTIGREYAIATRLGFGPDDLRRFTRDAIGAAFLQPEQRSTLLAELDE